MPHARITHSSGAVCDGLWTPAMISVSVMTPIVFCASFVPCASATSDDVKIWPKRNPSRPSGLRVVATGDRVRELGRRERDEAGGEWGEHGRQDHLAEDDAVVDRHPAGADDRRADQAAEQCVRRTRGEPEQPGEHVPGDRPDQTREDQRQERIRVDLVLADDAAARWSATPRSRGRRRRGSGRRPERRRPSGLRAPVAIGVAIAFAVSWKPFVKSKNSARTMTSTTIRVAVSTDCFP